MTIIVVATLLPFRIFWTQCSQIERELSYVRIQQKKLLNHSLTTFKWLR